MSKAYDALYLVSFTDPMGNGQQRAFAPTETLANATSFAREIGAVAVVECLLDVDPETQIETKLFMNDAGAYAVRIYDLEVGETVGVTTFPSLAQALTYYRDATKAPLVHA